MVSAPATEGGLVSIPGAATGGPGASKASERLGDSSWSRTVGQGPCAWCRLLGGCQSLCIFPKAGVHGNVCVRNSLANFKLE